MQDDGVADQDMLDWLILQLKKFGRASVVSCLYLASFIVFGAAWWKALLVAVMLIVLQLMSLGSRRIVQIGLPLAFVAAIYWLEIIPLQKWFRAVAAAIDAALIM